MLKEIVKYDDYNDEARVETLYFNMTKTEMMDLLDLQPRLEAWGAMTEGNQNRDLSPSEIKELLEIIKLLIEKTYGVRSEDGKHFRKTPAIFADFKESAVYDAFVFGLFEHPERAVNFMLGIMPKGLVDAATAEASVAAVTPAVVDVPMPANVTELTAVDKEVPAYIREDREPTKAELSSMSLEELQAAFHHKSTKS